MHLRGVSRTTIFALVAAITHLVLAWLMRTAGLGWGEDDAAFVLLSQQVQEFQYREVQDILAPVHARFPPGFPAMLAVVGKLFGGQLDAMFAFVAMCSAASVLLLFDAARRTLGDEVAVLAASLYAINPTTLIDAGSLMSEAPFKMWIYLALWAAVRETEGTRFAVVAGAATILAALTRTAGIIFIPALGAYWLWKRRYRWVAGLALGSLVVVAWQVFSFSAPDASDRRLYVADLKTNQETVGDVITARVGGFIPRLRNYLTNHIAWSVAPPTISGTPIDNVIWVVCFVVLGIAGLFAMVRNWTPAALFLGAYTLLLILWRYGFDRLVRPITPLLLVLLMAGTSTLAGRFAPRYRRLALYGVAAVLALGALRRTSPELVNALACNRAAPADSAACWPEPDREYLKVADWVRDSTASDARFFVSKERAFYFHSGRKSINQDRGLREDSTSLGDYLRSQGVQYAVITPVGVHSRRHGLLILAACREFELVKQFSRRTSVLRVLPERAASDSTPACAAARQFDPRDTTAP